MKQLLAALALFSFILGASAPSAQALQTLGSGMIFNAGQNHHHDDEEDEHQDDHH